MIGETPTASRTSNNTFLGHMVLRMMVNRHRQACKRDPLNPFSVVHPARLKNAIEQVRCVRGFVEATPSGYKRDIVRRIFIERPYNLKRGGNEGVRAIELGKRKNSTWRAAFCAP